MTEYERANGLYYDQYSFGLEGDTQFYVEEAKNAGSPVLELGCGTGRILIPIAESGIIITGLDRSKTMLSAARDKVGSFDARIQEKIELVEGDMRDFSLDRKFKMILIPFRAFLHLLTIEDQRQALERIREHLTPDGKLIFNIFDPSVEIISSHTGQIGSCITKHGEFTHPETGNRVIVWDTRQYDLTQQIVNEEFMFEEQDAEGRVVSKSYSPFQLRFIYRYEMQYLLELCGYSVEALYGDFRRGPFKHGGEQVWIASLA
jgi:ubiquinone/menaquinone biosynthesis C-methylase UbiE